MKPLKKLMAAIAEIGTSDIYTDAPEYANRTSAMHSLCALAGTFASAGTAITDAEIDAILADSSDEDDAG